MKRVVAFLMAAVMIFALVACETGSNANNANGDNDVSNSTNDSTGANGSDKKLKVVATLQSSTISYWVNVQHTWERLAKENDFDLTVMDCAGDPEVTQNVVDDIIAMKPDVVAFCGTDESAMIAQVKAMQAAGIPCITYNINPTEEICPIVNSSNHELGYISGVAAAEWWKENRGNEVPVGCMVDYFASSGCQDRCAGFIDGFKTVYADFEVACTVDGNATRADSLAAAEDALIGYPECNVFFGINGDAGMGIFDALTAANLATCDKCIVAACDGTEAECAEMLNEGTAYLYSGGNSPRLMAEAAWEVCRMVVNKEIDAYNYYGYPLEFVLVDSSNASTWAVDNFE